MSRLGRRQASVDDREKVIDGPPDVLLAEVLERPGDQEHGQTVDRGPGGELGAGPSLRVEGSGSHEIVQDLRQQPVRGERLIRPVPATARGTVVTGASSGIGREAATQLGAAGLNLVLVARRADLLEKLAATLRDDHGIEVTVLAVDLADQAGVERVGRATEGLDVGLLVAAAGYGTSGNFLDADLPEELDMLRVNAAAPLILSHRFGDASPAAAGAAWCCSPP